MRKPTEIFVPNLPGIPGNAYKVSANVARFVEPQIANGNLEAAARVLAGAIRSGEAVRIE